MICTWKYDAPNVGSALGNMTRPSPDSTTDFAPIHKAWMYIYFEDILIRIPNRFTAACGITEALNSVSKARSADNSFLDLLDDGKM